MNQGGYGQGPGQYGNQPPAGGYGQQAAAGYGQQAAAGYGQQAAGGYGQPAPHNPYAQAQKALSGAGTQVKAMQYIFIGLGAVLAVVGVVLIFVVNVMTGAMLAGAGVILAVVGLFVMPQFTGMMSQATGQVDALAYKAQLAQTGMPAQGRLIQLQQTGKLVNYNPEVRALVEVQHPQMGSYQVQTDVVVPQISIPQFQPGAQVQVRINPQNPQDVAIVV